MRSFSFLLALLLAPLGAAAQQLPHPAHVVVVIEENKNYEEIIGSPNAPYLNSLLPHASLLTHSYGLHHPSQPNYLELFSGDAQGVCTDHCPQSFAAANLARGLLDAHLTLTGYAESLPKQATDCAIKNVYGRKHCPWTDFTNVPPTLTRDFTAFPTTPAGFAALPTVAFVIPDLTHDMHNLPDGTHDTAKEVRYGDTWLHDHLKAYADWAMTNNSLLIITWDEDNAHYHSVTSCGNGITTAPPDNHIATIILGAHVKPGPNPGIVTHHNVLRTIEDLFGLAPIGGSAGVPPITGIWQ